MWDVTRYVSRGVYTPFETSFSREWTGGELEIWLKGHSRRELAEIVISVAIGIRSGEQLDLGDGLTA